MIGKGCMLLEWEDLRYKYSYNYTYNSQITFSLMQTGMPNYIAQYLAETEIYNIIGKWGSDTAVY